MNSPHLARQRPCWRANNSRSEQLAVRLVVRRIHTNLILFARFVDSQPQVKGRMRS